MEARGRVSILEWTNIPAHIEVRLLIVSQFEWSETYSSESAQHIGGDGDIH